MKLLILNVRIYCRVGRWSGRVCTRKLLVEKFYLRMVSCFIYFLEKEAESSEIDENVPTAEEATEATEGNAGSAEDNTDVSQTGVYTEHVFTDPLGVQIPEDLSPVYQSRYSNGSRT